MKQFLLPIVLICFSIFCLAYVHVDNMNTLDKEEIIALEDKDANVIS